MDSATALVEQPESQSPPIKPGSNKGCKHLTGRDVADILRYHAQGLEHAEIGRKLTPPRTASTVCRALQDYGYDNTVEAKRILRGGAADMALNIVRRGQPKDQVQALKGLGVLEEQQQAGLIIQVGGAGSDVKVAIVVQSSDTLSPANINDLARVEQG